MIPKRRTRPKMMAPKEDAPIKCAGHLKWVRGHECTIAGKSRNAFVSGFIGPERHVCEGRIEAHHTPTRGAGGGDDSVVPLCSYAHAILDSPGWSERRLEQEYRVDLRATALALWKASPHRIKYEQEQRRTSASLPSPPPPTPTR